MLNSVRARITLWYATAMALVLVALATVTYYIIKQEVVRRADAHGAELAEAFLSTVDAEMGDSTKPDSLDTGVTAAIAEHRFRDVMFVAFDPHSNLIGMSDRFSEGRDRGEVNHDLLLASLRPLLATSDGARSARVGPRAYRSYVRHFSFDEQSATVIVLQSVRRQNEFLETLSQTFAVIIPFTILLAAGGGYLLARRSLSPVVAMSTQASLIGAENLDTRLTVRNPNDELGQLAHSFNDLLDRLSISFERQKRFIADASHELRTPVAILCGETEVALDIQTRTAEEYRETLQILSEEGKRLKRIVEDLFTLARADAGQYAISLSNFYLDELAADCAKSVRTLAAAKGIRVFCVHGSEAPIHGDEALLRRMLFNLIENAIKYIPNGGTVSIQCNEQDAFYHLIVRDSGLGIPLELQPRIFERFFRANKARSRTGSDGGGAGLGLSIASWIAAAHRGRLELTSSTADGTTFTAILPKNAG
jgi:two-component system, OmpR family, sensor kinase